MITMIFILTGAAMFFEYKAVTSLPWLYRLMEKSSISFFGKQISTSMIPLMFSLCLSLMLGAVFGAAGLICFIAGLLSTLCMQPIYAMMRKGTWKGAQTMMNAKSAEFKDGFARNKNSIVTALHSIIVLVKLVIKIVMLPIRVIVWVLNLGAKVSERFTS